MQTYLQTFAAGEEKTLPGGWQFHLLETTGPATVTFFTAEHQIIESAADIQGGFRNRYDFLIGYVKIYSATAQAIKIGWTKGNAAYDRSQGDINVVSGILNRDDSSFYYPDNDKAFIGGGYAIAATGNFSQVQLWNPSDSLIKAILKRMVIRAKCAAPAAVWLRKNTAVLTGTTEVFQANKKVGSSVNPSCIVRQQRTYPALTGTDMTALPVHESVIEPASFDFSDALILLPGNGLVIYHGVANSYLEAMFEWNEITI